MTEGNGRPAPADSAVFWRAFYDGAYEVAFLGLAGGHPAEYVRQMGAVQADAARAVMLRAVEDAVEHRGRGAEAAIRETLSGLGIDLHG